MVSSVMLILGSFTPWITVSVASLSASINGTDTGISDLIGVNGWITFSAGILLFVLVCMVAVSDEPLFRTAAVVIALVAAGFAVYDLVRVVQKISNTPALPSAVPVSHLASTNVGWGLIVVVIGAAGALVCSVSEARSA
jgi:hypothetical protein